MTWQRFVNRNGLRDGDYGTPPQRHQKNVITNGTDATALDEEATTVARAPTWAARVDQYERAFSTLAGDIRRLERDLVDEWGICGQIAQRTGIPHDCVATVLKEFLNV
jgi:hypothetical protein